MIFWSILAKSYAFVLGPAHWGWAWGLWAVSVLIDAWVLRNPSESATGGRRGILWREVLWLNVGAGIVGWTVGEATAYAAMRWKDGLPGAATLAALLLRGLGLPVAAATRDLHLTTMAGPLRFTASVDGLGLWLPAWVGAIGAVFLFQSAATWRAVGRKLGWIIATLTAATLIRLVMSVALFVALCDFVGYETEELPVAPFVKPGGVALLFLPVLLLCGPLFARVLRRTGSEPAAPGARLWFPVWGLGMLLFPLMLIAFWEPQGRVKSGKVLINTYHTQWSRTDRPYDREWYGADSGYNYACLKRWFEAFYEVQELKGRIQAADLEGVSVLLVYIPDRPFNEEEKRLIVEFVRRGGGLFLIGDHTNVFGSTSHLNELSEPFGFLFRDDVLFDLDEDFFQLLDVPRFRSSFLHGMSFFKFRGPASIEPTSLWTRSVMHLDHAKGLRAIYSVNNFYPPPHDDPGMTTGRFCVSAASRFGEGRVVAFGDSTIFSNFEIFYPGKYEYLLNAVHWLNHRDHPLGTFLRRCALLGAVLLVLGSLGRAPNPRQALCAMMVVLVAFQAARSVVLLGEDVRASFPMPVRPLRALFFAADADDPTYVLRAFVSQAPYDQRYDVLVQWALRTGVFSAFCVTKPEAPPGLYEHLQQSPQVEIALGLIVRGPEQLSLLRQLMLGPGAKATRLMLFFSRTLEWKTVAAILEETGILTRPDSLALAQAAGPAAEVVLNDSGRRVALAFSAERFSDQVMGFSEKVVPDANQRALFDRLFGVYDALFAPTPMTITNTLEGLP
jgi:hypothetical protein